MTTAPATAPTRSPLLRILLVEDDESIHRQLGRLMQIPPPADVELISVKTIAEADEAIRAGKPSVILLDLNLSTEWPWDRTLTMIETLDRLADAPVIVFSGLDPDTMWHKAVQIYGAYNFFSKKEVLDPNEFVKPTFRGQLIRDITNAIFQHKFRGRAGKDEGRRQKDEEDGAEAWKDERGN